MPKELFDNEYLLYEDGRLYSNKRNKFLTPSETSRNKNYLAFGLNIKGIPHLYYLHRLLGEAFIPNPNNYPQINHLDGNTRNNNVNNLEWCTASHNVRHSYDTGLRVQTKCSVCGKLHYSLSSLCSLCRAQIKKGRTAERVQKGKGKRLYDEFINTDFNNIPEKHRGIVLMRQSGCTFQEIANKYSFSRQYIQYLTIKYKGEHHATISTAPRRVVPFMAIRQHIFEGYVCTTTVLTTDRNADRHNGYHAASQKGEKMDGLKIIEDRKIACLRLVTLEDRSGYVEGKSTDGGGYIFYTYLLIAANGAATVTYGTSADFSYCPINGDFRECSQCSSRAPRSGLCREEPHEMDAVAVKILIAAALNVTADELLASTGWGNIQPQ